MSWNHIWLFGGLVRRSLDGSCGKEFVLKKSTNCWTLLLLLALLQADQNQAIAMISYFASSAEPAQVRGKNVYLQYSNRQEIVNSKSSGEAAGNVLLVSMEGVLPDAVSIDVLHLVRKIRITVGFILLILFSSCLYAGIYLFTRTVLVTCSPFFRIWMD